MRSPGVRRSALAAVVAVLVVGCSDGAPAPDPTPTAAPSEPVASPRPQPTGNTSGALQVDLSALAEEAGTATSGPLSVQACLGGRCSDHEIDPDQPQALDLDTAGLEPGATTPVTVRVTAPDGTVLAQQQETVTLGGGPTTVVVQPLDGER